MVGWNRAIEDYVPMMTVHHKHCSSCWGRCFLLGELQLIRYHTAPWYGPTILLLAPHPTQNGFQLKIGQTSTSNSKSKLKRTSLRVTPWSTTAAINEILSHYCKVFAVYPVPKSNNVQILKVTRSECARLSFTIKDQYACSSWTSWRPIKHKLCA